jgi:4-amino-4-deoxy-L-arabinose transferase-like glycosyltransferase
LRRLGDPWLVATLLLAAVYLIILAATAPDMGFVRDEGYYFKASEQYGGFFDTLFSRRFLDAFSEAEIQRDFSYNTEHPALVKLTQAITYRVGHKWLGVTGPSQGFRLTGFLFAALSLFATYLLGAELVSKRAGFIAALLLAAMPRYFYDAHLACFDVPITALWTLALATFWRGLTSPIELARRRAVVAGVIFGLALATKLNALFLPPIFVLIWLHQRGTKGVISVVSSPSGGLDLRLPDVPWVLVSSAVIGPLVFIALWPWLWHDTIQRILNYVGFHLHHEHYPILFFQDMLVRPPFPLSFAWVMTAFTVPSPVLILGAIGLVHAVFAAIAKHSTADFALALGVFVPILLLSIPGTPIFGGVKHWYNALPALAVLAARSIEIAIEGAKGALPKLAPIAAPAAIVLAVLPGALGTAASHPNGIAFYNEIAGGFRGGAELGMQRSFWGGLNRPLMPQLAREAPGSRVFFDHMNYDSLLMYQREGVLPSNVWFSNEAKDASAATVFEGRENPTSPEAIWSCVGTRPSEGVYADEVTLVELFTRAGQAEAGK